MNFFIHSYKVQNPFSFELQETDELTFTYNRNVLTLKLGKDVSYRGNTQREKYVFCTDNGLPYSLGAFRYNDISSVPKHISKIVNDDFRLYGRHHSITSIKKNGEEILPTNLKIDR